MKALTLTQPWATLIAIGAKQIETRSWTTRYRGPLAIHAGKGLGPVGGSVGLWNRCAEPLFFRALEPYYRVTHLRLGDPPALIDCIDVTDLPLGAIVAVAELVDCWPITDEPRVRPIRHNDTWLSYHIPPEEPERAFGDYSPGRYAWLLADVRPLAVPVPARGAQGLWDLPVDVAALIAEEGL